MQVNPYLLFNGNCEAAFKFYEQHLGGKIESMTTHAGTPAEAQTPPEWRNKILHARMTIDGSVLMGSDAPPPHYRAPQGFSVTLNLNDPAEADRIYQALSANGQVRMAIQKTFWATRFAMFTDSFGVPWMINCD